jgi:3-methyladenine DNA glycosylase AlkD
MAEKIQINFSNDQKKSSDEQFLQAPRNWQKCSALASHFVKIVACPHRLPKLPESTQRKHGRQKIK